MRATSESGPPPVIARPAPLAALLGVLGTAVSATLSWRPSLWQDEAASLLTATRPLASLPLMLGHIDIVHALYYLFLRVWVLVFGTSAFAIRFPSAIAAGCCVAAVALLAHRVGGARLALAAGLICAVLPRMTYDGQDARSYAFDAALAAWLSLVLLRALENRRRRWWVGYAALLALGTVLFVFTALVALAHGVALACSPGGRRRLRAWAGSVLVALVLASPVVAVAVTQRQQIAYLQGRDDVLTPDTIVVQPWFESQPLAVLGWVLLVLGLVAAVRAQRGSTEPDAGAIVAVWFALPSVVLLASSTVVADFSPRYLSMCIPAVALTMALGLRALAGVWRPVAALGTVATVALAAPTWWAQRQPDGMGTDWAAASSAVGELARPGDGVVFDTASRGAYRVYPADFAGLDDVAIWQPYWRSRGWNDETLPLARAAGFGRLDGIERVWFVEERPEIHGTASVTADVESLRRLGFRLVRRVRFNRNTVLEFARR